MVVFRDQLHFSPETGTAVTAAGEAVAQVALDASIYAHLPSLQDNSASLFRLQTSRVFLFSTLSKPDLSAPSQLLASPAANYPQSTSDKCIFT